MRRLAARDAQEAALKEDHKNALAAAAAEAERVKDGAVAAAIAATEGRLPKPRKQLSLWPRKRPKRREAKPSLPAPPS